MIGTTMASIHSRKKKTAATLSLLDRLTDRSSREASEATIERGELPETDIEAAIQRDLGWLLNTTSLAATTDLSRWPNVRRSVLNYGVSVFTGRLLGNADVPQIESALKKAIALYEPRLRKESIRVQAVAEKDSFDQRAIRIRIEGEYSDHDETDALVIHLTIDTETGRLQIEE